MYAKIKNGRSFNGEIETENELVLIDELECNELSYSQLKKELNKEFKFCSYSTLTEYFNNLISQEQ
jgi:hypothetical protein